MDVNDAWDPTLALAGADQTVLHVGSGDGSFARALADRQCHVLGLEAAVASAHDVVVVHDTDTPAAVLDEVESLVGDRLQLVPFDRPFNFSEKCNRGVISSYGDVVLLLNDDVEITDEGFVTELVAPLFETGVGMTGAHLVNADTMVQHAGLTLDRRLEHLSTRAAATVRDPGPFLVRNQLRRQVESAMAVNREVSGVTAAALAIKRSV